MERSALGCWRFLVRISVGSPAILTEVFSCCFCCCEEHVLCSVLDAAVFILPSRILGFHLLHNLSPSCRDSQCKRNLSWSSQALAVKTGRIRLSLPTAKFRYKLKCETSCCSFARNCRIMEISVTRYLLLADTRVQDLVASCDIRYGWSGAVAGGCPILFSFDPLIIIPTLLLTALSPFRKVRDSLGQVAQYSDLSL